MCDLPRAVRHYWIQLRTIARVIVSPKGGSAHTCTWGSARRVIVGWSWKPKASAGRDEATGIGTGHFRSSVGTIWLR